VYPSHMGEVIANGNNAEVHWNTDTSGTAFIEVQGLNDCGTGPIRQFITVRDYCTEIDEPGSPSLTIFPNPFRNRITISLPALKTGAAFTLSDLKGNRLLHEPLESNRQEVSLQQLPRGMYILKVINGEEVNYRKVVKK
ncbi:MAG: T9SS type A sorting domain-containing protein, partial [Bacteroidales bacterium]|nr:T9SS type A sorting domain-containing protein [Bacteroidales bacterium]